MNKDSMNLGGSKAFEAANGGIGEAGGLGFGVGVCTNEEDLAAMSLTPMDGCDDPSSENYGNYVHSNGSVMVYVPAFCYRIGQPTAPSYERDGANALEIGSPDLDGADNWILHRAFIDGGQKKSGFFMDKYLCSKSASDSNIAVSVKNADQISTTGHTSYIDSSSMTGCSGAVYDAITLSRARGDQYACVSCFQWSAIAMLTLAHGQAVTSSENCAWYDTGYEMNFPKGSNNSSKLNDVNDTSVKFTAHSKNSNFAKTGSGVPFGKTTHNGQASGITDINGCMWQPLLGIYQSSTSGQYYVAKESFKMHDFTTSNYNTSSNFDSVSGMAASGFGFWGNGTACVFNTSSSGAGRAICGVIASSVGMGSSGTNLFGKDQCWAYTYASCAVLASGNCSTGTDSGVWYRYGAVYWDGSSGDAISFRAAGYPPSVAPWGGG